MLAKMSRAHKRMENMDSHIEKNYQLKLLTYNNGKHILTVVINERDTKKMKAGGL